MPGQPKPQGEASLIEGVVDRVWLGKELVLRVLYRFLLLVNRSLQPLQFEGKAFGAVTWPVADRTAEAEFLAPVPQ